MKQNNKLQPYIKNKGIINSLETMRKKTPSLFNITQALIVGIGKPVMAIRAGFYKATGGFFANSSVPWFKIIVILVSAYVLTYKNLNLNFNLNSPQATSADFTSMGVSQSLSPAGAAFFDDEGNRAYIERFQEVAVSEMEAFGIPASIKLGQALLESNAGKSTNAMSLNNHFNLRCGELAIGFCTETPNGMFNEFKSSWDGWRTHSELLVSGEYATLKAKAGMDYKVWANGLKELGYNADKQYAEKLIKMIEYYNLQSLDVF